MSLPLNIDDLIHQRKVESARIEYKKDWNPEKVLHSVCAFANDIDNWGGGYIIRFYRNRRIGEFLKDLDHASLVGQPDVRGGVVRSYATIPHQQRHSPRICSLSRTGVPSYCQCAITPFSSRRGGRHVSDSMLDDYGRGVNCCA